MKKQLFTLIVSLLSLISLSQERVVYVNLQDKDVDSIRIKFINSTNAYVTFGVREKLDRIRYNIPDSVFNKYFLTSWSVYKNGERSVVNFFGSDIKDYNRPFNTLFFDDKPVIELIVKIVPKSEIPKETQEAVDKLYDNKVDVVFFHLLKGSDTETTNSIMYFREYAEPDSANYIEATNAYKALARKYPNSYVLSQILWIPVTSGMEVDDAIEVYNTFSERVQNMLYGKRMYDHIKQLQSFVRFENMDLPNGNTLVMEPIMSDTTKYNLVIFSTSWCGPCKAMIPQLKEIYSDLNPTLDLTYITADKEEAMDTWRKQMKEEAIPWRHLWCGADKNNVINKYMVQSYPTVFLVYPGGKFKIIDPRNEQDKAMLYELAKKK